MSLLLTPVHICCYANALGVDLATVLACVSPIGYGQCATGQVACMKHEIKSRRLQKNPTNVRACMQCAEVVRHLKSSRMHSACMHESLVTVQIFSVVTSAFVTVHISVASYAETCC